MKNNKLEKMKVLVKVLVVSIFLVSSNLNAQDFQGVAIYKTMLQFDIKMDSTKMNSEMHSSMMEMMKKQFQKTYTLAFNKEASVYKEDVALDKPQANLSGNFQFTMIASGGGQDVLYKNTKTQSYTDQKDTMGKIFLVKDSIQKIDWKLEADTKYIGEYQCYKATYTKEIEVNNFSFSNIDSNKEEEEVNEPKIETRIVTAWYTPQVPINNGPAKYQGLPGLILEIHDDKLTIICSKIILNPEEKLDIKEPNKGKEVRSNEYEEIMEKKSKEMMEQFAPRKGGKGEVFEIRIGG